MCRGEASLATGSGGVGASKSAKGYVDPATSWDASPLQHGMIVGGWA
jgi:hypothetical protein